MKSPKFSNLIKALSLTLVLALALTGLALAANVNIDSLNSGLNHSLTITIPDPPGLPITDQHQRAAPSAIGGARDLILTVVSGDPDLQGRWQALVTNGYLNLAQDPGVSGLAEVQWDDNGDANPGDVVDCAIGLGGVDLKDMGLNTGVSIHVIFSDLTPELTLRLYTDCSNWAEQTITLPGGVSSGNLVDVFLPFDNFSGGAGTLDPASINAIVMVIDSQSDIGADVQVSIVEATDQAEFGDLPITYAGGIQEAYHYPQGLILGSNLDNETAAQPNADATGDDISGTSDEDGVTRVDQNWTPGANVDLSLVVNGCPTLTCSFNGWIDFNNDGTLEQIFDDEPVGNGTPIVSFNIPGGYVLGQDVFARFRLCPVDNTCDTPTAQGVLNGEIEDYFWKFSDVTAVTLSSLRAAPRSGLPVALAAAAVIGCVLAGGLFWRTRRNRR